MGISTGITGIHSEHASYRNAYINRAGFACLVWGHGVGPQYCVGASFDSRHRVPYMSHDNTTRTHVVHLHYYKTHNILVLQHQNVLCVHTHTPILILAKAHCLVLTQSQCLTLTKHNASVCNKNNV